MEDLINKIYDDKDFINIIKDIIENDTVLQMKEYRQHYRTNCFDHCLLASYYCYKCCKKFHLDYISSARAAMLHDLFLYDWRKRENGRQGLHAFTHPITSYENASKLIKLNDKESDIILKHMWPVTFFRIPKYKESFLVTFIDKYCAWNETLEWAFDKLSNKKLFRYAYIFLHSFAFVRI